MVLGYCPGVCVVLSGDLHVTLVTGRRREEGGLWAPPVTPRQVTEVQLSLSIVQEQDILNSRNGRQR